MWPFKAMIIISLLKAIGYWTLKLGKKAKKETKISDSPQRWPSVDIILPMYNEAKVIINTIRNLLAIDYDDFSIIVVDDGSTDGSFEIVKKHFGGDARVLLMEQANGGKSAALNKGMSLCRGQVVITIDADTWIRPDAIKNIVEPFKDRQVAAVAGYIKVGNRVNLLTDMQYFEYISIWDNDREMFDKLNGILVVPGALGAFRCSIADSVGGFKTEMIAEDTELTLRLLYNGYAVRNKCRAVAYTEAPDNLKMFFRQRVRWTAGLVQGLIKHNKKLFAHSNRSLTCIVLPYTWLFRLILPFLLPMADYYFLVDLICSGRYEALPWWSTAVLIEGLITLFLLKEHGEKVGIFRLLILQRIYRHLLFCNYWLMLFKGINGTLLKWNKITRKGNITLET
jgi:cellulose synthase/poly-beta-1,6-N-acetylglucosamine synthase-like glycosyltransferase